MEERAVLREVPTGKIELVYDPERDYSTLQFNCHCLDALEFCKGMCCRMRQGFAVVLKEEEYSQYKNEPFRRDPLLRVLQRSEDGKSCYYLDQKQSTCTIHHRNPSMCRAYHCSPGGKGDGVKHRDGGWFWTPVGALQQLANGDVIDVREISKVNIG